MTQKIIVVTRSARKQRLTPTIANYVIEIAEKTIPISSFEFESVDLKEWIIPFDAEESIPRFGNYETEQVLSWSRKVKSADGFIIVTPEYNYGYPGVLKHGFDLLYNEFTGKPVTIVTFGGHGGQNCNEQLQNVLGEGFNMKLTKSLPNVSLSIESLTSRVVDKHDFMKANQHQIENSVRDLQSLLTSD